MIAAALGLALAWAQDPVQLEIRTPRREYYPHERIPIELRFGFERSFREQQMLAPFRRELDLPVMIEAGWLPPASAADGSGFSFALNGTPASAQLAGEELRDGRPWDFYAYATSLRADAAGELALPAAALRYAVSSAFTEDPIQGRIATDRQDRILASEPLRLTILPLPSAGRPQTFRGAVGSFTIEAAAAPVELAAGEPLQLLLRIAGDADPASFEPPDLSGLPGLELRGQLDDRGSPLRSVVYEFVPADAGVNRIPPIEFAFFDPGPPAGYRLAATAAIPLLVRGAAPAGAAAERDGALQLLALRDPAPVPARLSPAAFLIALLIPAALCGGAGLLLGRRERDRRDPLGARARRAAAGFRRALSHQPEQASSHYVQYLAARLRLPPAAPVAPDLAARLIRATVPEELARRAAGTLESLLAARYGGPDCADGAAQARARVRELEIHFRARPEPSSRPRRLP